MKISAIMTCAARAFEFGCHIPVSKLERRAELTLRRSLRDRLRFVILPSAGPLERSTSPPRPIFAPRSGRLDVRADIKRFSFLGHGEEISGSRFDWWGRGQEPRH